MTLLEFGETLRVVVEQQARLSANLATRDGQIMAEFGAIHDKLDRVTALAEHTAVRTARIDKEREVSFDDVRKQRREAKALAIQLADLDKREAVNAAQTTTKLYALEKREALQDDRLERTGQQAIDATMRAEAARIARGSQAEIEREVRAEIREEKHDNRGRNRAIVMWGLGVLGIMLLATFSACLGSKFGGTPLHIEMPIHAEHHE